jgi:ribosomal protein L11 methylase PrmA
MNEKVIRYAIGNFSIKEAFGIIDLLFERGYASSCSEKNSRWIVANILADPLITIGNAIASSLKERGVLVLSGFTPDENDFLQKYLSLGLKLKFRYDCSWWVTLVLGKIEHRLVNRI